MIMNKNNFTDFEELNNLMQNGINTHVNGKAYYTGYSYKALYDWDQYFEAIVQIYMGWDTKYIKNGIEIFLDDQEESGFIVRVTPVNKQFPGERDEHAKPFFAQILLLLLNHEGNIEWFTQEYYVKLKKYLLYWLNEQDRDQNGLPTWNSGPHCGMDNQHERAGYWGDCFCEGIDLASFLYRELKAFCIIAETMGHQEDALEMQAAAEKIYRMVQTVLWDEKDGFFYDRNEKTGQIIKVKSIAAFSAMWAGIATKTQAERLVKEHLLNPAEFWRPFPVPAYAATETSYSETPLENDLGCYWRANTWIPTNYIVFHSLQKYGYTEIAEKIANTTYDMVKKIGNREFYTSETLQGLGCDPFWGWSLLAYFMPI